MNRYEDVFESTYEKLSEIRRQHFPELKNAKIKIIYDLKKRVSGGQICLAKIVKPNDLVRFFTKEEAETLGEGYDYIIVLDKVCWNNIDDIDRVRILRHELRHTFYDIESENNPYRLVDHEITDFYDEITLNQDDPRWKQRVAGLTDAIYDQMKEEAREAKRRKKRNAPLTDVTSTADNKTPLEVYAESRKADEE